MGRRYPGVTDSRFSGGYTAKGRELAYFWTAAGQIENGGAAQRLRAVPGKILGG